MSSAERSLRHGEVKLLKSLKRSLQDEAPRRRRTLKPDSWTIADGEDDKSVVDIRDIDFRLKNDSSQLKVLILLDFNFIDPSSQFVIFYRTITDKTKFCLDERA